MPSNHLRLSFVPTLALAISGLVACDSGKKLDAARAEQSETARKAANDSAELQRKQTAEVAALASAQHKEVTEERREVNAVAAEQRDDARELGADQAKERADLARDIRHDALDVQAKVAKAADGVDSNRNDLTTKARERLAKLDARATDLKQQSVGKGASTVNDANRVLADYDRARNVVVLEVDALPTTAAKDVGAAERGVEAKLDALEKILDRLDKKI